MGCTGQKRESTLRGVFEIDINFSLIFILSFFLVAACAHPIKNCILKGPYNRSGYVIKMLYFPFSFHTFPPVGIQTWFKLKMLEQQDRRKQGASLSLFTAHLPSTASYLDYSMRNNLLSAGTTIFWTSLLLQLSLHPNTVFRPTVWIHETLTFSGQ